MPDVFTVFLNKDDDELYYVNVVFHEPTHPPPPPPYPVRSRLDLDSPPFPRSKSTGAGDDIEDY